MTPPTNTTSTIEWCFFYANTMKKQNSILKSIQNILPNSLRSFENLKNSKGQQTKNCSDNSLDAFLCKDTDKTNWYPIHKTADSLSGDTIFANSYELISTKVYSGKTLVKSEHRNSAIKIQRYIDEIGFDAEFRLRLFDILYRGCGACLCLIEDDKIRAIPFFEGEEIVKVTYNKYKDRIVEILIQEDTKGLSQFYQLDLENTDYYILYNIREGDTFKSNLTIAAPYIFLSNALLNKDIGFAETDFSDKVFITPKIKDFLTKNGDSTLNFGGKEMSTAQFVNSNIWGRVVAQIEEKIKKQNIIPSPVEVDIKKISQTNSQNQTDKIREYCDLKITQACHSSASILGKSGSNRAESEQQRDNFDQNTVKIFQELVCRVANDFLLPLFAPNQHNLFRYQYYSEETDETIALREQNLKLLETIMKPDFQLLLDKNKLSLSKKQLTELIQSTHGLEALDQSMLIETTDEDVGVSDSVDDYNQIRAVDQDRLSEVYTKYHSTVNMSYSELLAWSERPLSREASLDRSPIQRNLELLNTKKADWTNKHITWANKTIAYKARHLGYAGGDNVKIDGKDTGWNKRDIGLANWAINVKKNTRSLFDNIRSEKLPTLDFEDINTSDFTNILKKALTKQYKDIANNSIRIDKGSSQFDDYLSSSDFLNNLRKIADQIKDKFNKAYKANIEQIPERVIENINRIVELTYNGGTVNTVDIEGKPIQTVYDGFDNTQVVRLKAINKLDSTVIERLVSSNLQSFKNNLLVSLFNETYDTLAIENGAEYIGISAKNDKLVRRWHLANSGYAWRVGTNPPDSTNPNFYFESNCRCSRVYGTKEQLSKFYKIYN